ncbi:hypothetical protein B0H13DRAFT_2424011 [Mycena leptocephala]|nr:hypothetical protein B0H13DRAFT_2424011 [Mycena leptocephala]
MYSHDPKQSFSVTPRRKHHKSFKDSTLWPELPSGLLQYWESTHFCRSFGRDRQRIKFLVNYLQHLGVYRTMKQVNSHLQVLRMMFMGSAHYYLVANAEVWSPTLRSGIVPAFGIDVDDEKDGDWKPHEGFQVSGDFWDYPRRPFLGFTDLHRSAALRCQLALIDSDPDVLYHITPNTDGVLRYRITDKKMSVSFCRVRDTAVMTRNSECIAILAQTLVAWVVTQDPTTDLRRIDAVYRQLEEEYAVPDVGRMVVRLVKEYKLTPSATLRWFHEVNMAKHG